MPRLVPSAPGRPCDRVLTSAASQAPVPDAGKMITGWVVRLNHGLHAFARTSSKPSC